MSVVVERRSAVVVVTFSGRIDYRDLERAGEGVDAIDQEKPGLPRLVLLADVTGARLGFQAITQFASRRRQHQVLGEVREAIVADADAIFGLARMFQLLFNHPQTSVEVFRDPEEALAWLGVAQNDAAWVWLPNARGVVRREQAVT